MYRLLRCFQVGSVTLHALKNKKYAFIGFELFLSQW